MRLRLALRLSVTELRRLASGALGKLTVVALLAIPSLYAGFYLYANHDPYGRLDRVPAALVVQDAGTVTADGRALDAGRDLRQELLAKKAFDWRAVDAAQAAEGVRKGTYYFALTVPRDFSAALASTAGADPRQARLRLTTNDANSYLSTTIANSVVQKVRAALAAKVGTQAANGFLLGLGQVRAGLSDAAGAASALADGAAAARDGAATLSDGARAAADGAGRVSSGVDGLRDGLGTLTARTAGLPEQAGQLAGGARQVADGTAALGTATGQLAAASRRTLAGYDAGRQRLADVLAQGQVDVLTQQSVLAVYDALGDPLRRSDTALAQAAGRVDALSAGAAQVADGSRALADGAPALVAGLTAARDGATQLSAGASALAGGARRVADGAGALAGGAGQVASGSAQLRDGLDRGLAGVPATTPAQSQRLAATIGDPVAVSSVSPAAAESYGGGLAPYFLALALWVGGYAISTQVRALSRRALAAGGSAAGTALGGWLAPVALSLAQVLGMYLVVRFGVGIAPARPVAALGLLALTAAAFLAVIHLVSARLGRPGQFVVLVLLVLQLISAGGTFPWQTLPSPLYPLHHVLPMAHAVDGLRQVLYGGPGSRVLADAAVLAAYLLGALVLTTLTARRQRTWTASRLAVEAVA